ncbi:MAG TPA: DUF167 domain-containing protein [Candidatus Accumulibacter phosphatis]|nr:MAG: hypothetical protein AW07_01130 [Candidatus Accumulibacter sp. SK-11]HAY27185.1 DUF167 domain-containing protein [Accumulibacter sp.]HCN67025.1 DUF167 domain-containing protein [Accumulibacter sp.]HRL75017.1 DUF167 domain-containing protein [Candidatus Accumulibacter phosphatis]HRQ93563.1 DUF167 domain-containing protein [Candidatus Accumulibacter phosphatis]
MSHWARQVAGTLSLTVHVQPGAKRSEVAGEHGDALKIRLVAAAIDGRANAALVDLVAQRLDVPRTAVVIRSGQTSRRKLLLVSGAPTDAVPRLLGE